VGADADDVARMDGPAFHEADDLLGDVERPTGTSACPSTGPTSGSST